MTNIINGDIFESHCEMLVLPISTAATISFSLQSELERNKIQITFRKNSYHLGDIETHKILNHKYIKYIVLACSVKGQTSNYLSIGLLGNKIANAAKRIKSIKNIGIPLLGTGSGRLGYSKSLSTLFESFYKVSHQSVDLIFCIPDSDTSSDLHKHFFTSRGVSILRVKQLIFINQKTKSKELDLGNCGIDKLEILPELFDCTHLEKLILSNEWGEFDNGHWVRRKSDNKGIGNNLQSLPNELSKLNRLKIFICGGDWSLQKSKTTQEKWGIENISVISLLSNLTVLNISNNNVREIGEIYKLKKLQKLYLNNNKISSFPDISSLKYLSNLYLSNNEITNVEFLKEAFSLKTVDLHSNAISDLTPLKELISKIGIADSKWTDQTISITSNRLQIPRPEIISQGKEKVIAYFKQLEAEQDIKLPPFINKDIKLILVGNSSVGKSTLLHWLKYRIVKKDIPTTHWMVVDKWQTKFKTKDYTVRIFDFGGQEYYHDTHHLFFTNNTGYLVLWDSKTDGLDQTNIEQIQDGGTAKKVEIQTFPLTYWLDSINFQTNRKNKTDEEKEIKKILDERDRAVENSVKVSEEWTKHVTASIQYITQTIKGEGNILVIQNKVDTINEKKFIDEKSLKENHGKIFDFMAISIWEERGLVNFEESLFQLLDTIPMIGKEFLGTWGIIKNKIESERFENPYTLDDFRKFCNSIISKLPQVNGKSKSLVNKVLFTKQDAQSFAQYLNDNGILLYFPENKDLSGKIFINQSQILKNIYDTLKGLETSHGQLNVNNVIQNLGKKDADEEVSETIKLMLHFKIIFQHPSEKDSYIAPLYLPKEPATSIKIFESLFHKPVYRYEYKNFIYKNVILAFFSSYGQKALKESEINENYYYWKEGLILKDKKTEEIIMVKFFPAKNDICLACIDVYKINGSNSDNFLNKVIQDLDDINQDWDIEKTVPSKENDFIPLSIIRDSEKLNNWVFPYKGKMYNLVDFKKYLNTQLKMKKIFISYSKADANHLAKLENHLSVMKRNGTIATWNCRKLLPGEKWDGKIKKELEEADLILFLVSDDFLATDYIWDIEIKRAIERDNDPSNTVTVIPIIVRACDWEESPLGVFNTAPKKAEVINSADDIDVAWTSVVKDLKKVL